MSQRYISKNNVRALFFIVYGRGIIMADKKSGGLVPLCNGTVITWTMPPLISGFLVTSSITGSILQLINIVLDVLICMPFMSALNKRQLMEENKAK